MAAYGDGSRALRYTPLLLGHSPETPHQWDREHHQTQTHSKARSRARQQDRIESLDYTLQEPPLTQTCSSELTGSVKVVVVVQLVGFSWS
jgi:ligand-binding sensor protein